MADNDKKPTAEQIDIMPNMPGLHRTFKRDVLMQLNSLSGQREIDYEKFYGFIYSLRMSLMTVTDLKAFTDFRDEFDKEADKAYERFKRMRDKDQTNADSRD